MFHLFKFITMFEGTVFSLMVLAVVMLLLISSPASIVQPIRNCLSNGGTTSNQL